MQLARLGSLVGLVVGIGGALILNNACSSDSGSTSGGGGGAGAPPKAPDAPATTSTDRHSFALHTLILGDRTRSGTVSNTAWKTYGYNLDGKVSTKDSTDVCKPPGNNRSAKEDGNDGIDNAFGSTILPFITSVAGTDAPDKVNTAISDGSFTIIFDTKGLTADPAQTNTGLTGGLYAGGKFSDTAKPTFTTADDWPVRPELLNGGNVEDPKVKFTNAFITNGKWVNGSQSDVTISLVFSGQSIELTIHQAVVTFDHKGSKADNGTIAGIIATEELVTNLKKVAGRISGSLCGGQTLDNLLQTIRNASDIMADGSQNPAAECNGISVGIGFVADEIKPPSKAGPLADPGEDPCASTDAGTGGG